MIQDKQYQFIIPNNALCYLEAISFPDRALGDEIVDVDSANEMGLEAYAFKPRGRFLTERGNTVPKFQPRLPLNG